MLPVATATQPDRRARTGYVMVVTAALLWAVNGTVSKVMLVGGMPAADLAELRATGAFVVPARFVAADRRRATLRMTRRELPAVAVYGLVGFVLGAAAVLRRASSGSRSASRC